MPDRIWTIAYDPASPEATCRATCLGHEPSVLDVLVLVRVITAMADPRLQPTASIPPVLPEHPPASPEPSERSPDAA